MIELQEAVQDLGLDGGRDGEPRAARGFPNPVHQSEIAPAVGLGYGRAHLNVSGADSTHAGCLFGPSVNQVAELGQADGAGGHSVTRDLLQRSSRSAQTVGFAGE
ncbi:hypothetical protein PUR34_28335 [Streptomyces sp. JV185]|uniref:hypothetical protein n=1 Tax=Streptomyces sp. JV185 TaxID=858638 RepID=UPI002E7739D7|nr:hypothetical protein [Streptomyces sp. JV185]MEE1771957.1 hypothetical protein [Streptomyces sp. JV185]